LTASLSEYAKTTPIKGVCGFCKQKLPPQFLPEVNAGIDIGLTPAVIVAWLKDEHGLDFTLPEVSNHIRGYKNTPERHQ